MLTKPNNRWEGFSAKGAVRKEVQKEEPQPKEDNKELIKAIAALGKKLENVIPVEAEFLGNGISNAPFDKKKKLVYLGFIELYLEAQLAEVREKKKELLEEELNEEQP